jgi:hypothetical protein
MIYEALLNIPYATSAALSHAKIFKTFCGYIYVDTKPGVSLPIFPTSLASTQILQSSLCEFLWKELSRSIK